MSAVPDSAFDEFDEELSEKLLWEQLKGKIEEAEWDAVQRMLGHDVIDRNQELNTEAEMLREILNAYRVSHLSRTWLMLPCRHSLLCTRPSSASPSVVICVVFFTNVPCFARRACCF
jgi:hypothetical protein